MYYQFKVIAENSIGNSPPSEAKSIIAATTPDAPNAPTLVFQDENTIEVQWTANYNGGTPIDDYQVFWKLDTDADFLDSVLSTGNTLSYRVDIGLDTGLEYDFKVRARNDVGLSSFSSVSTFMAAKVPDAPAAPTSSFADRTSITIDWTAPYNGGTPITNYRVQWNLGGTGTDFYDLATVSANTLTFTQGSLTTGEIYKWRIVAINVISSTGGPPSDHLSIYAATVPLKPSKPIKVIAD